MFIPVLAITSELLALSRHVISKLHVTRLCHKRFGLTGETNRVFRKLEQKNPTVSYFKTICIAAFLNKDGTIMKKIKENIKTIHN